MRALLAIALLLMPTWAWADQAHIDYVAQVLEAVRTRGPEGRAALERDLYTAARTQCRSGALPPAVDCLVTAARDVCRGDYHCELAADVIVENLRAANDWVDAQTRARLVRESTDYRAALAGELHKRYAALAAELVLAETFDAGTQVGANTGTAASRAQAAAIDHLCATRDRAVHACTGGDTACVPSIAWSRCVAALVWFVGGAR